MPKEDTYFKPGNEGRKPGVPNRLTRTVKETVLAVFNELQDDPVHNLTAFAKKYPKDFHLIAAKLIPTELTGALNIGITWEEQKTYEVEHKADTGA